jgi:plasmid maintenance system killer protein
MEFSFGNRRLEQLYAKGKSNKYKFLDKAATRKFFSAITVIVNAVHVSDFQALHSLKFEHLERNSYSMRLSRQIRLELEIAWKDESKTSGVVTIKDITKHYE